VRELNIDIIELPQEGSRPNRPTWRWPKILDAIAFVVVVVFAGYFWDVQHSEGQQSHDGNAKTEARSGNSISELKLEVVTPHRGGIDRICVQPSSVEPFESADIYAKVSGFLIEQSVDIGSRVKVGQTLAMISIPEQDKQVERDAAKLDHEKAKVAQMEARIVAALAEEKAAIVSITLA
jgi:multidrug efflux pump subunit AcrA (membrane-fusion protein)